MPRVTLGTPTGCYLKDWLYDVPESIAAEWISKGLAAESDDRPQWVHDLMARLDEGADESVIFLPPAGMEFGHEIMSHVRIVHFSRAARKVVCCRPGNEVLYPSAAEFVTDWTDPLTDMQTVGTSRGKSIEWPNITARFPDHRPLRGGVGLTSEQEIWGIRVEQRIEFKPKLRGMKVDVVFGTRHRQFAPEKNWLMGNWRHVADSVSDAGFTYAVIGSRPGSFDLPEEKFHSADYDTDAAIELIQNCRLFVGTDTGSAHLAATVGAPMLIFREPSMRSFIPRMQLVNPKPVEFLPEGWTMPDRVAARTLEILHGSA